MKEPMGAVEDGTLGTPADDGQLRSTVRVAGIDCGTNSIRLLVADFDPAAGRMTDRLRSTTLVRLGQDVDRTGRLAPEAIERTRVALADYVAACREDEVRRIRMVATSATRDATNREDFRSMVLATLGAEPEVVSGDEEAELSFTGAVRDLAGQVPAPHLVSDLGGGSTELVLGDTGDQPRVAAAYSMDIGSVRLTERHLHDDPPTAAQVAAAERDIRSAVEQARSVVPVQRAATFVGVSGTVTTVAALAQGLSAYEPDRIHHSRVPLDGVRAVADRMLRSPHAERAASPVIQPGRVDVIGAGALILRVLMEETGSADVVVSERDILDGLAWSVIEKG
jgi:exopolyphosphatase/guanosine-5'-triphosphate,3'-diphosphate pyrophosphatase